MGTAAVAETVADGIEEVAEHIDEVADVTRELTGHDLRFFVIGSVVGLATGAAVGYFLTKGKLQTKYDQIAQDEINEMRTFYAQKEVAREQKPDLDKVVEELGYIPPTEKEKPNQPHVTLVSQEGGEGEKVEEVTEVSKNVFETVVEDAPSDWDYETEKRMRGDAPFIIHADEYTENEHSFDQVTYTFYEEDDVLADVRDHIVEDVDNVIGLENLQKFGHGSNDPSIVYIRNVKLELDCEVTRNPGSFGEQVHGFIKHSDDTSRRRKRRFDDGTSRG